MARMRCVLCRQPNDESAKLKNITFRSVPWNRSTRLKWQEFCNQLYKLPRRTVRVNGGRVCSLHFTEDCFYTLNGRVHTKPNAVPTLYVEPVICNKESMKNKECLKYHKITMPCLKEFDQIEKQVQLSENSSKPIMSFSTICHQSNKKNFNGGVDYGSSSSQSCERILLVEDNCVQQTRSYNERNKIFNNTDEKNRELSMQIKEKSESLIHFIESVMKSSTSYQSNEKYFQYLHHTRNDIGANVKKSQQREIPLYRVVDFMKKARSNKNKIKLELSNQIIEKSESLTQYIESTIRPSTSYQSIESHDQIRTKKLFKLKRDNFNVICDQASDKSADSLKCNNSNSDVAPSERYGKKNICIVAPIK